MKRKIYIGAILAAFLMLVTPCISAVNVLTNENKSGIFPSGITGIAIMENLENIEINVKGETLEVDEIDNWDKKYHNVEITGKLSESNSVGLVATGVSTLTLLLFSMFATRPHPVLTFILKNLPGNEEYKEGDTFTIKALSAQLYVKQHDYDDCYEFDAMLFGYQH